jgi:hypothetical protein
MIKVRTIAAVAIALVVGAGTAHADPALTPDEQRYVQELRRDNIPAGDDQYAGAAGPRHMQGH